MRHSFSLLLACALVGVSLLLHQFEFLQRWDNLFYDFESTIDRKPLEENIVIIAIDDESLQKLGRWPWPRAIHARLINLLTDAGVAGIGLDVLFLEPDIVYPEDDIKLAEAIERNGRVVLPVLTQTQQHDNILIEPIKILADGAEQLAHVSMNFDAQGVARGLRLQFELQNGYRLPAMSLAVSRLSPRFVEPPAKQDVLINFAGPPGSFRQLSYVDVLQDFLIRQTLKDKLVLIGTTATGIGSRIATPVSKTDQLMSGIEFHANALASIQSGLIIRKIDFSSFALLTCFLVFIPVAVYPLLRPRYALTLLTSFALLTLVSSYVLMVFFQLWFAPVSTLVSLALSYPMWSLRRLEQLGDSLFRENEKVRATLNAIGDAVITTNTDGTIEIMNPAAEKMLALTSEQAAHQDFFQVCQVAKQTDQPLLSNRSLDSTMQLPETLVIRNKLGKEFVVRVSSRALHAANGQLSGIVYALTDLTEIMNINRKIAFMAAHDSLTELPNRVLLQDRLEQAIVVANREKTNFAVLFIDLDGFKKINDGMGHASGDSLLQQVAKRLRKCIRQSDTIARWGGDEFVILLEDLDSHGGAADVAVKIIECLAQPYQVYEQKVFVTCSVGITLYPDDGQYPDVLLAKADAAMYGVKRNGRNNFCFYSHNQESLAKERLIIEQELHYAFQTGQFVMYYQPQIDLVSGRLIGVEALIRWLHPEKGMIPPDRFIPLTEEMGLIVPIGEWIIKTACQQVKTWESIGVDSVNVAINLSPRQFNQEDLVKTITREIERHQIASNKIQVEITESMMISNTDQVIQILNDLKSAGISIAVDDFGTGFSSLEKLKRFPIDKLKIDKSFINSVLNNADDASIVQAVIALGHSMDMQIIAEGVETLEQYQFLQERQCDYGQGYFFSKPLPDYQMHAIFHQYNGVKKLGGLSA